MNQKQIIKLHQASKIIQKVIGEEDVKIPSLKCKFSNHEGYKIMKENLEILHKIDSDFCNLINKVSK